MHVLYMKLVRTFMDIEEHSYAMSCAVPVVQANLI